MSNGTIEFLGFWGFLLSVIFVGLQIYYNRQLIKTQIEIAQKQNETQIQIAKEQFETQRKIAVQQARQEWINELREEVANFSSAVLLLTLVSPPDSDEFSMEQFHDSLRAVELPASRIKLMLNVNEEDHNELDLLINEIILNNEFIENAKTEKEFERLFDELDARRDKLMTIAPIILKREWERVKRGE